MRRVIMLIVASVAVIVGCSGDDPAQGRPAVASDPPAVNAVAATDGPSGQETFEFWCAPCHAAGAEHPGTRRLGERLGPDLAVLLERPGLEPAYVQTVVRNGFQMMPPFRTTEISDEQLQALSAYVADASRAAAGKGKGL